MEPDTKGEEELLHSNSPVHSYRAVADYLEFIYEQRALLQEV